MKNIRVKDPMDEGYVSFRSARLMYSTVQATYRDAMVDGEAYKAQILRTALRKWREAILTAVKLALVAE